MADDLSLDGLSEDTQKYIRELRQEAARYRTERNEFKDKYIEAGDLLKSANDQLDDYSAVKDQLETTVKDKTTLSENYDRLRAAAKFGIPDEVNRLQGSSYEEWEKDAETLAGRLTGRKTSITKDPAAGQKPPGDKTDPILDAFRQKGLL